MRSAALVVLAACWTGEPAVAPAPIHLHAKPVPPPRVQSEEEAIAELQTQLRDHPATTLPQLVDRGVVALDFDTGTVATLCDAAALAQSQVWAQLLADPARPSVVCTAAPKGARCIQVGIGVPLVLLDLQYDGDWRLAGVMTGIPSPAAGFHQYQAQLESVTCP